MQWGLEGGLAACVLLEKVLPIGHWLAYAVGGVLVIWGICLVASDLMT